MQLIFVCAAAIFGIAIGVVAHQTPVPMLLASVGGGLMMMRWRLAGAGLLAFALGGLRASGPPVRLAFAPNETLAGLREAARGSIAAYMPEPQASLASGVLLGGSGHLDSGFKAELGRSGLAHLVAIDGFKEIVVAAAVMWLLGRAFGGRIALLAGLISVVAYAAFTGAHPSAIRAAIMVALASVAAASGRVPDSLTSLVLGTLGMALLDPRVLLDLGLQLSLSATLGIILLWPRVRREQRVQSLPRWVREPVGLTAVVTVACLPVSLSAFRVVSLISPIAHVVAVPLLPLILASAAVLALAAALLPPLAVAAAWLAWVPASVLTLVIHVFGSAPGAAVSTPHVPVPVTFGLAALLLGYGLLQQPELRSVLTTSAARRGSASSA